MLSTVVSANAEKAAREDAAGVEHGLPHAGGWWSATTSARWPGSAMRTAPFAPYPLFLLPMPGEAAAALAHVLHERGGAGRRGQRSTPGGGSCAGELARLEGGAAETVLHSRLHEATEVVDPAPAPGRLRLARPDEAGSRWSGSSAFATTPTSRPAASRAATHDMAEDLAGIGRRIHEGGCGSGWTTRTVRCT